MRVEMQNFVFVISRKFNFALCEKKYMKSYEITKVFAQTFAKTAIFAKTKILGKNYCSYNLQICSFSFKPYT
jgi:hypothetical protein